MATCPIAARQDCSDRSDCWTESAAVAVMKALFSKSNQSATQDVFHEGTEKENGRHTEWLKEEKESEKTTAAIRQRSMKERKKEKERRAQTDTVDKDVSYFGQGLQSRSVTWRLNFFTPTPTPPPPRRNQVNWAAQCLEPEWGRTKVTQPHLVCIPTYFLPLVEL